MDYLVLDILEMMISLGEKLLPRKLVAWYGRRNKCIQWILKILFYGSIITYWLVAMVMVCALLLGGLNQILKIFGLSFM